jgi:hypothetical protein
MATERSRLPPPLPRIALTTWITLTCSVLQGDTGKAEEFLQRYSPHHQREEAAMLLNRLGKTVDMIEYDQKIKGFIL